MNNYLIGAYVIGAVAPKPAAKSTAGAPTVAQAVAKAGAAQSHVSKAVKKVPPKFSGIKSKLSASSSKLGSKVKTLQTAAKTPSKPVSPTAAQRGGFSAPNAGSLTAAQVAQQRGGFTPTSPTAAQRGGFTPPKPVSPTAAQRGGFSSTLSARQQRGIMGDGGAFDFSAATIDALSLATIVDNLASLADVVSVLSPIVDQLTAQGQSSLAASGQAIIDSANAVINGYDPNSNPSDVTRGIDGQTQQIVNSATGWQAKVQAQTGVSASSVDAQYVAQAQAIAAAIAPVVAQLTAAGQTTLAQQGQAIVDSANTLAQGSGAGAYVPGSAAAVAAAQRGAM